MPWSYVEPIPFLHLLDSTIDSSLKELWEKFIFFLTTANAIDKWSDIKPIGDPGPSARTRMEDFGLGGDMGYTTCLWSIPIRVKFLAQL